MKKNSLVTLFAIFCFGIVSAQQKKPNIIMIAVDDLNDWVGVYGGNPQVKTPNMDKLAQTSVVFRNASCPGPVCGPSRSALLSGFMPEKTGVYGNAQNMLNSVVVQTHATLPEYFSKNGYITISKGKIFHKHLTENGEDHGNWAWDVWEHEEGQQKINPDKFYSRNKGIINGKKIENALYSKGGGSEFNFGPTINGKETMLDYQTAKWFEQKLDEKYDKPFFMAVGISKPHLGFHVPEEYFNLYGLDTLKVAKYKMDDLDDILDKNGKKAYQAEPDFLWAQHYGIEKEVARAYMASVSFADECVGVVLDALAKSKYADNTIVILFGDHGWHLGEKLRYRKATLWREATQLPFIFHLPGMTKMQNCTRNVNLIDIYPTLIDLCNLPKKELDGKSMKPLFSNPTLKWTPALTTMDQGNHSVMTEKWHYISRVKPRANELYDLEKDPMEWNNLISKKTPEIETITKKLNAFVPQNDVVAIPKDAKGGGDTDTEKTKGKTAPDLTIKATRILSNLK
jgi:arylsulfatase A-like enzyme